MKQKVNYSFPEIQDTKRGVFWIGQIKFAELVKDPCLDTESEIDHDFEFIQNICIPVIKGKKESELFITLYRN